MALIPSDGNSRGILLICMCAIFWPLSFLAVVFRVWARRMKNTRLAVNDYAIFVALFFGTGLVVIVLIGVLKGGMGQHAKTLQPSQLDAMGKILVAGSPVWAVANMFIKISILHLYCTIFWKKTFQRVSYSIMAFAICLAVIIVLQAFLICRPFAFNWDPYIPGGKCGNQIAGYKAQAIINIAIDISIVVLPVPMLWTLQLTWSKKLGIYFMFSVGMAICVITGLRFRATLLLDPLDITYTAAEFALLNMLETTLGIVNTCLPVCRPSLRKLYPSSAVAWTRSKIYSRGSSHNTSRWYGSISNRPSDSESKNNAFQKINDVDQRYPLTDIMGTQTESAIVGGDPSGRLSDLESQSEHSISKSHHQNIRVLRQWEVKSNSPPRSRGGDLA